MTHDIEKQARDQISEFLPHAIGTALKEYQEFIRSVPEVEESKKFSAQYSACKTAIAHIDLLLKLAKWAELPDPLKDQSARDIWTSELMGNARKDVARARVMEEADYADDMET